MKQYSLALSLAAFRGGESVRDIAVLPEGVWYTDKYGKLDLSAPVLDDVLAAFEAGMPPQGVFIDVNHDFGESRGRVIALARGTYTDPKYGDTFPAICATVEFTAEGAELVDSGKYGYASAAFGQMTDVRDGTKYEHVLRVISLTNMPVLGNLGPLEEGVGIAASELLEQVCLSDVLAEMRKLEIHDTLGTTTKAELGEVIDDMRARHAEREDENAPADKQAASWGSWEATSSFGKLVREAVASGLESDALKARIATLAADLPDAVMEAISNAVDDANSGEDTSLVPAARVHQADPTLSDTGAEDDPVKALLSRFDGLMDECDAIVKGTAGVTSMRTLAKETRTKLEVLLTKKGGTTTMSDEDTKLAEERDDALAKLATMERTERTRKVNDALDKLSAKGMAEPARKTLSAILLAEKPDMITLSEGSEPVDTASALLAFAETVEFVPVEKPKLEGSQDNKSTVMLSDAEIKAGKDMGVSEEYLLKAKEAKLAAEAADEAEEE